VTLQLPPGRALASVSLEVLSVRAAVRTPDGAGWTPGVTVTDAVTVTPASVTLTFPSSPAQVLVVAAGAAVPGPGQAVIVTLGPGGPGAGAWAAHPGLTLSLVVGVVADAAPPPPRPATGSPPALVPSLVAPTAASPCADLVLDASASTAVSPATAGGGGGGSSGITAATGSLRFAWALVGVAGAGAGYGGAAALAALLAGLPSDGALAALPAALLPAAGSLTAMVTVTGAGPLATAAPRNATAVVVMQVRRCVAVRKPPGWLGRVVPWALGGPAPPRRRRCPCTVRSSNPLPRPPHPSPPPLCVCLAQASTLPLLYLDGPTYRQVPPDAPVVLAVTLALPPGSGCVAPPVPPAASATYTWRLTTLVRAGAVTLPGYLPAPQPPVVPGALLSTQPLLALPAHTLPVGGVYTITATAALAPAAGASRVNVSVTVTVEVASWDTLGGGSLAVSLADGLGPRTAPDGEVALAVVVQDRDGLLGAPTAAAAAPPPAAAFVWECNGVGSSVCPAPAVLAAATNASTGALRAGPGEFAAGAYTLRVTVTAGAVGGLIPTHPRVGAVAVNVTVPAAPQALWAKVTVTSPPTPRIVLAPGDSVALAGAGVVLGPGGEPLSPPALTLQWSGTGPSGAVTMPLPLPSRPGYALVSGAALLPGTPYVFTLTAAAAVGGGGGVAPGAASVTVVVNAAPRGGAVTVTPAFGHVAVVEFVLATVGWTDDVEVGAGGCFGCCLCEPRGGAGVLCSALAPSYFERGCWRAAAFLFLCRGRRHYGA
jgi:hypothetical protein